MIILLNITTKVIYALLYFIGIGLISSSLYCLIKEMIETKKKTKMELVMIATTVLLLYIAFGLKLI